MNDITEARTQIEDLRSLLKRMQARRAEMHEELEELAERIIDQDEKIEFLQRRLKVRLEQLRSNGPH